MGRGTSNSELTAFGQCLFEFAASASRELALAVLTTDVPLVHEILLDKLPVALNDLIEDLAERQMLVYALDEQLAMRMQSTC